MSHGHSRGYLFEKNIQNLNEKAGDRKGPPLWEERLKQKKRGRARRENNAQDASERGGEKVFKRKRANLSDQGGGLKM